MPKLFSIFIPKDKPLFKYIFFLAIPVILTNISRVFMGLVDMLMVANIGIEYAVSAVSFGGMIVWFFMGFGISLRTATQSLASRRLGQKKLSECSTALWNMQLAALIIGIPMTCLCYFNTENIFSYLINNNSIELLTIQYSRWVFLGIYFVLASFVFQGFYTGIEKTKIHMYATVGSNLVNLYFNIALIYGSEKIAQYFEGSYFSILKYLWLWMNFPELKIEGAGIATLIASGSLLIFYIAPLFKKEMINTYKTLNIKINHVMLKTQINLAAPLMITEIAHHSSFILFYAIIENKLGVTIFEATAVVFRIMHASFMPAIGVAQACATVVGKSLGENNIKKAESSIVEGLRGSFFIMGGIGLIFILFAQYLVPPFVDSNLYYYDEVIKIAIPCLVFLGVLQFIDPIGITMWFALGAAGDTKYPAVVDFIVNWFVFIPMVYVTCTYYQNFGIWGPWSAIGIQITLLAVAMAARVKQGKWKTIEV